MSPAPARRSARPVPSVLGGLALAAVLLVQGATFVAGQRDAWQRNRSIRGAVGGGDSSAWNTVALEVLEELAALEPLLPPDARVLLVSESTLPIAYDFPLLPHPLRVLVDLDALEGRTARLPAATATLLRDFIALMQSRDQRLDAASLAACLADADCLVTVHVDPAALPWPPGVPAPRLMGRRGVSAAWQLGPSP